MKIDLKAKIQEIITAYRGNAAQNVIAIKVLLQDAVLNSADNAKKYTPEFLHESIVEEMKKITEAEKQINQVFNQKLNAVIAETKKILLPQENQNNKPADYQIKINNAIQFIKDEGDQITDETAFLILKDFVDDYRQMKLFKNMIGKKAELENTQGTTTFPLTFGKLNQVESILNLIIEIETIASMLFLYNKTAFHQEYVVRGCSYFVPADPYSEIADEESIINLAEALDKLTSKYELSGAVSA